MDHILFFFSKKKSGTVSKTVWTLGPNPSFVLFLLYDCLHVCIYVSVEGVLPLNLKLEELLVEETWLEALPGELHKPYAKKLCEFVESEIKGGCDGTGVPIYPPPHLIFNALNTTSFDRVKAVIIGQVIFLSCLSMIVILVLLLS